MACMGWLKVFTDAIKPVLLKAGTVMYSDLVRSCLNFVNWKQPNKVAVGFKNLQHNHRLEPQSCSISLLSFQ